MVLGRLRTKDLRCLILFLIYFTFLARSRGVAFSISKAENMIKLVSSKKASSLVLKLGVAKCLLCASAACGPRKLDISINRIVVFLIELHYFASHSSSEREEDNNRYPGNHRHSLLSIT